MYDLRSTKPLLIKDHQYGLPINSIAFENELDVVLSSDSKILKIWDRETVSLLDVVPILVSFGAKLMLFTLRSNSFRPVDEPKFFDQSGTLSELGKMTHSGRILERVSLIKGTFMSLGTSGY